MKICMKLHWRRLLGVTLLWVSAGMAGAQGMMNNAEVITLMEAGMSDEVILEAIASARSHNFDTSAKGLVTLKNKGASPAVLRAVLNPKSLSKSGAAAKPSAARTSPGTGSGAATDGRNPENVAVLINGTEQLMQYIVPTMRTAARALGFGGVATYATLPGDKAQLRLPGDDIGFVLSVPKNAQPQGYLTLANFAVRPNGTREVATGGGFISYSTGITRDRVIPVAHEVLADQGGAREGFVLYHVKPERQLAPGEYALILYTAEVRVAGFFGHGANSFFDFGVD